MTTRLPYGAGWYLPPPAWWPRVPGRDPYDPAFNPYDDGYPGHRAPPPDLTDEAAFIGLGPREGDETVRRPRYPNARWGSTGFLALGRSVSLVITPLFDDPCPIGFQLRFSADGVSYSSVMPPNCGIDVKLTKSFDPKAGKATEFFGVDPGLSQPVCMIIARSLTITAQTAETALQGVWIQAVACPLTALDCDVVVPPPPTTPAGYASTTIARYPAVTADQYNLAANPKRAMVTVSNQSAANLFVSLHGAVDITPGSEFATIVLPPGSFSGLDYDNYQGEVFFQFDADDDEGYALVTEGFYP